ncbi:MAG: hypothetical protein KGM17_13620 [Sphingomonadales bacterium]|nr:hypothetical protein [Sphingomonadales bacterium]
MNRAILRCGVACGMLALPQEASAGPPFFTDDPAPTARGKWEIFDYAGGTIEPGGTTVAFGLDLNYAPTDALQAGLVVPLVKAEGERLALGDVEVGMKVQLLRQDRGAVVDLSTVPRLTLPTGRGTRSMRVMLPLWAERDFGDWSLFGGGGWTLNTGAGRRNYWQGGFAIARRLGSGWQGGVEVFSQGATAAGERPLTVINAGTILHVSGPVSLLGSFGQGINRKASVFYTALKLDL